MAVRNIGARVFRISAQHVVSEDLRFGQQLGHGQVPREMNRPQLRPRCGRARQAAREQAEAEGQERYYADELGQVPGTG